ncbi:hypothetical protein CAOG_07258 [Capsaspora owczarzaki ATCC 30864]|uniref:Cytochrome b561 domain-containing protein n=1 Tax=Capsaspora owczarzaki (strain ATCC 30864) TaxID=595528 RepID=A0A0D2WXB0_CAPO3|nr:hypothetical protein CAOG_07258 [Capsaspora owczarzaki ATCC 30864]KJE97388.1 hypothetical protein CAOG_007258 [Capsaspora owczarzaki ATCC 30864]|eukprot:XP_004343117.1 hypothetical protein CAOG_07258 [Capsaspora owczarzaki ATCC 30864]
MTAATAKFYTSVIRPAVEWLADATLILALAFALLSTHAMLAMIVAYVFVVNPFVDGQGDGGVSLDKSNPLFPNTHPLCMGLAFGVFMPEAALVYRWLPASRPVKKYLHSALHTAAIVASSIGWYVSWNTDEMVGFGHFNRLHSHIGLIALFLFYCQYLAGFFAFLFPGAPLEDRPRYAPNHKFAGVLVISIGAVAICTGVLYIQTAYAEQFGITDTNQYFTIYIGLIALLTATMVAIGVSRSTAKQADTNLSLRPGH